MTYCLILKITVKTFLFKFKFSKSHNFLDDYFREKFDLYDPPKIYNNK